MLHLDTKNSTNTTSSFTSLLAFKPRQVLLAQHNPPTTTNMTDSASNHSKITPHSKPTLHEIILDFLHRNGFSKTLKRFQSEAKIQTDDWKGSSLHLEDIFSKHNVCDAESNKKSSMKTVLENGEALGKEKASPANEETTAKKKKKKKIIEDQPEVTDEKVKESSKNLGKKSEDITVSELETQPKKKKVRQDSATSTDDAINGSKTNDLTKKSKDKKKTNIEKVKLEPSTTNEKELVTEIAQKEKKKRKKSSPDENRTVEPDVTTKSFKKRKRSSSDENEFISTELTISEESNRQKTETSREESNGQEMNGKLETDGVKSRKKQRNVSTEPKTVNAFQRVKIDEVEFADEKLQDNSYWAKDGAEIGYGAKAQEVLGQVRGRDFRHEKTKKKRGSYRGGLIDQQSHSIKFNYSDED